MEPGFLGGSSARCGVVCTVGVKGELREYALGGDALATDALAEWIGKFNLASELCFAARVGRGVRNGPPLG